MPIEVDVPGVGLIEFPDEMGPDQIKGVLDSKFRPPAPTQEPFQGPFPKEPREPDSLIDFDALSEPQQPPPQPGLPQTPTSMSGVPMMPEQFMNMAPGVADTKAGRLFQRLEGTAPAEFRTPAPPREMTQEDLEYGTGSRMITEAERRIQAIKDSRGKGDMPTEEFVREHPDTKYAIYGLMAPTDLPAPRLSTQEGELLFGKRFGGTVAGVQQGVADFADFMTSMPGVMLAITSGGVAGASGTMGPIIHRTIAQTFAVDMARHLPDQFVAVHDAIKRGDDNEAARGIFNGLVSMGIIGHGARSTLKPLPQAPPTSRLPSELSQFMPGGPPEIVGQRPGEQRSPIPYLPPPRQQVEQPQTPGQAFERGFKKSTVGYQPGVVLQTLQPKGGPATKPVWQQEGQAAPKPDAIQKLRDAIAFDEEMLADDAKLAKDEQLYPDERKFIENKIKERKAQLAKLESPAAPAAPAAQTDLGLEGVSPEKAKLEATKKKAASRKKKPKAVPSAQAEFGLSDEEIKQIDAARTDIDVPIDIKEKPPGTENEPFSSERFFGINRERGSIELYLENYRKWLAEDVPAARRDKAIRSALWEERIHLATDPNAASAYWNSLSGFEKGIEEYAYTGFWGDKARQRSQYGVNPQLWGAEALRRRIQGLMRMEPTEIAAAARTERWTLKGLSLLETGVRGIREKWLRTEASKEGRAAMTEVLDELQGKIDIAKQVVTQQQGQQDEPGAIRRGQQEFWEDMPYDHVGQFEHGEIRITPGFKSSIRERTYPQDPYFKIVEKEIAPGVWVDNSIADVLLNLNRAGLKTMFSDSGMHVDHLPTKLGEKMGYKTSERTQAYVAFERLTDAQQKFIVDAAQRAGFQVNYGWREGIAIEKLGASQKELKRAWDDLNSRVNTWADQRGSPGAIRRGREDRERQPWEEPDFVPYNVYAEARRRAGFTGVEGESVLTGMPEEYQKPSPYKKLDNEFLDRLHESYVNDTGRYLLQTVDMFRDYPDVFDGYQVPPKIKALYEANQASLGGKLSSKTSRELSSLGWDSWRYLEGDKSEIHPQVMDFFDFVSKNTDAFTNIPQFYRGNRTNRMLTEEFVKEKVGDQLEPQQVEQVINDWSSVRKEMFENDPDLAYWIEQRLHPGYERPESAYEGPGPGAMRRGKHRRAEDVWKQRQGFVIREKGREQAFSFAHQSSIHVENLIDRLKFWNPDAPSDVVFRGKILGAIKTPEGREQLRSDLAELGVPDGYLDQWMDTATSLAKAQVKAAAEGTLGWPEVRGEGVPLVGPGVGPGAMRRGKKSERAEIERIKYLAAMKGVDLSRPKPLGPPVERPGAQELSDLTTPKGEQPLRSVAMKDAAKTYLESAIKGRYVGHRDLLGKEEKSQGTYSREGKRDPLEHGRVRSEFQRPNFRAFARWVQRNVSGMKGAKPSQLIEAWQDAVHEHLRRASDARLEEWRRALKFELTSEGKYTRKLTDMTPEERQQELAQRQLDLEKSPQQLEMESKQKRQAEVTEAQQARGMQEAMEKMARMEKKADDLEKQARELEFAMGNETNPFNKFNMETRVFGLRNQAKVERDQAAQITRELHRLRTGKVSAAGKPTKAVASELGSAEKYRRNLISKITDQLIGESMPHSTREAIRTAEINEALDRVKEFKSKIAETHEKIRKKEATEAELDELREGLERAEAEVRDLQSLTLDDIDFSTEAEGGAYTEFSRVEQASPKVLTEALSKGARKSKEPVSVTRRLAVLQEKTSGRAHVVSAYKGPEEMMLVDPSAAILGSERPNARLTSIMKRFNVVATVLLKDPVQNYHKPFGQLSDFMNRIGKEAKEMERSREYSDIAGEIEEQFETETRRQRIHEEEKEPPPGLSEQEIAEMRLSEDRLQELEDARMAEQVVEEGEIRGEAGAKPLIREGGGAGAGPARREAESLMGMGRGEIAKSRYAPITKNEIRSVYEYIKDESRMAETPEESMIVVRDLLSRAQRGKLQGQQRAVISALQKVTDALSEAHPNLTPTQAAEMAIGRFYDALLTSKSEAEFIQQVMADFGEAELGTLAERDVPGGTIDIEATGRPSQGRVLAYGKGEPLEHPIPYPPERLSLKEQGELRERPLMKEGKQYVTGEFEPGKPEAEYKATKWRTEEEKSQALMERGINIESPGAMRRGRKIAAEEATRQARGWVVDPWTAYSDWMVDRLRRAGITAADRAASDRAASVFNDIISREKGLYGKLSSVLEPARKAAGGLPPDVSPLKNPKQYAKELRDLAKATKWAHELKSEFPGTGTVNAVDAIERGRFPAYAEKLFDYVRPANRKVGELYETKHPLMVRRPKFKARGDFQRNLNEFGYDLIRQGNTPLRRRWARAIERLNAKDLDPRNRIKAHEVEQIFNRWKEALDRDVPDILEIERVNQDYHRRIRKTITHLLVGRKWEPVIHSDLYNYLEASARKATHVTAYRHYFPNTRRGRAAYAQMRETLDHLDATDKKVLGHILRTLQGTPTDTYSRSGFMSAGKPAAEFVRFVNSTLGNLMAKMVLTGQMFVQPGEVLIGSTPLFLGYKNYMKALGKVSGRNPIKAIKDYNQLLSELEKNGAVNRVMYDWSWNPTQKVRSGFRIAGNVVARGSMQNFLNEFQELMAATTADVVANKIVKQELTGWERKMLPQTFKAMGFNPSEVGALMGGNADVLNQFKRRASAWLTTGNKAMAEGSPISANRLVNSIFRFQSYPMMKANQMKRLLTNVFDAGPGERATAIAQLAKFFGGNALQGALTVAFTTLAYKGFFGGKVASEEARDEPAEFAVDSMLAALGGPLYLLWKGWNHSGLRGIGDRLQRSIFPWSITLELIDAIQGDTPAYKDRDTFERIGAFIENKTPGTRALSTGMALFGLGSEDRKLQTAMEGFWRWRRDYYPGRRGSGGSSEKDAEFRKHMRRAIGKLKEADKDGFMDEMYEALGTGKDRGDISRSLLGRRVLVDDDGASILKDPDAMAALEERIGEEAVSRLRHYDKMLEAAADGRWLYGYDE